MYESYLLVMEFYSYDLCDIREITSFILLINTQ